MLSFTEDLVELHEMLVSVLRLLNCTSKLTCSKKVLMHSLLAKSGTRPRRLPESSSRGDIISDEKLALTNSLINYYMSVE